MPILTDSLERILNWLQQYYPSGVLSLQPGLTFEEIEEKVKKISVRLPQEVYEFYRWRNGSKKGVELRFARVFSFMECLPVEEAIDICQAIEAIQYENKPLFPLFEFEGEYLSIVLQEEQTSPVIFISEIGDDVRIRYTSLTSMMLTIAESYETGAYYVDEEGYLQEDELKVAQISRKFNPELTELALFTLEQELSLTSLTVIAPELMQQKEPRAVEPLIRALQVPFSDVNLNENVGIRALAARILGEIGDTRAVEPLIIALQDEYWWMTRYWAAISLGKLKDRRAAEPLTNALQDSYEEVRQMARWAIGQLE